MSRNPETIIQDAVADAFRRRRGYVIRMGSASVAGTADLVVCFLGEFWWVEIKTPDGVQSPKQRLEAKRISLAGGRAVVVRSAGEAVRLMDAAEADMRAR